MTRRMRYGLYLCASGVCLVVLLFATPVVGAVEFGQEGSNAGQINELGGLAAGPSGEVLALDKFKNKRVNVFTSDGGWADAFGWGVLDGGQQLETCTSACEAGLPGSGAGEIAEGASGLATSVGSGNVFVADQSNSRVEEFTTAGTFVVAFGREVNKSKVAERQAQELAKEPVTVSAGEEDVCDGAADNECGAGAVGSGEAAFEFSGEGTPITVGTSVSRPSPIVYVGSKGRVEMFEEDGTYMGASDVENAANQQLGQVLALTASTGTMVPDVYVVAAGEEKAVEYEETNANELTLLHELVGVGPEALAYDGEQTMSVLVEHEGHTSNRRIFAYDVAGQQTEAFPAGGTHTVFGGTPGLAYDKASKEACVTTGIPRKIRCVPMPPAGPLVIADAAEPEPAGGVRFTAKVDPEAVETRVSFEYESSPGSFTRLSEQTISGGSAGDPNFNEETTDVLGNPIEATAHLQANTTYKYRVRTENVEGVVTGPGFTQSLGSVTTLPAAEITGVSATNVSATGATLTASVNPLDEQSKWWFEYAPVGSSQYVRTSVNQLPAADEGMVVSAQIGGLSAGTAYHVRLAVENALAEAPSMQPVLSDEIELITEPAEATAGMLDGRRWEMVSPASTGNASFEAIPPSGGVIQAAANGEALTYLATGASEATAPSEPSPEFSQVLSIHGAGGWRARDIASRHEQGWGLEVGHFTEFMVFSSDLTVGLVEPKGQTVLGDAGERSPYLRVQDLCEADANGCYEPLANGEDVTSGEKWGGKPNAYTGDVSYASAAPDLKHLVLSSSVPLTAGASGGGLYEWSSNRLSLVSVLPGGSTCQGDVAPAPAQHAVSSDGDRVIWSTPCEGITHVYMHEAESDRTVQIDAGSNGDNPAEFQDASASGSRVFFVDREALTPESHAAGVYADLYVFEANADTDSQAGVLRDLTVPVVAGESAGVYGAIPGISEDGSVAYVVAGGVLSTKANEYGEAPQSGQPNLYRIVRQEAGGEPTWVATFIATLSSEDSRDWGGGIGANAKMTAHISPDGRWLAFMSNRSLTGYDNRDAASGLPDEEVFLYDGATGRLVCASCEASGARPHGLQVAGAVSSDPLVDRQENWKGRWLAGELSGWDTDQLLSGVYPPRYVSDDGRLFFNASGGLVSGDVNGSWDVYELEPAGVGSCNASSASYSAAKSGCVGLISGGASGEESVFLDASESGNDVFFLTAAKLVSQDVEESYAVYDAHVCGVGWECPPIVGSTSAPPCESAASCKTAGVTAEGLAGPPASMSLEGAGNLVGKAGGTSKSSEGKSSRIIRLRQALARCRRAYRHSARRRGRCERAARKRTAAAARSGSRGVGHHHRRGR